MHPVVLAPNLMRRPYRGGSALAAFRGLTDDPGDHCPEDWIASTTTVFGAESLGLSTLPDGRTLRAAIEEDPTGILGPEHVAVFGADSGVLLKLIDAQQRLSVHVHPDRAFTRDRLGTAYGKTEAWFVVSTTGPEAAVYLGFTEDIAPAELLAVVESGQGASLLDRMNRVPVAPGDAIFVPAGTPHAIGAGVLLVEAQEPSDLLVRLEWGGYVVGSMPSELGLGFETALQAVDHSRWPAERLASVGIASATSRPDDPADDSDFRSVLPALADGYFRLDHVRVRRRLTVPAGFSVLLILSGRGRLTTDGGQLPLRAGQAILLPHDLGPVEIDPDPNDELDLIRARPAAPEVVRRLDPELSAFLAPR